MQTFLWHDYETFGVDPRVDRPAQFAAVRTDLALNEIQPPITLYCQIADDYLPQPEACVLTGITPRLTTRQGLIESEFAATIFDAMSVPGSICTGYNSLRFDDEVSRHLFYRNLFDPYVREYANHNARWDLIDVVRMCYALRPQGLVWPMREDGAPSFRLEALCQANDVAQAGAHDALVDVYALIGLARRLKSAQPRLWAHALKLSNKLYARSLLDEIACTPVVHVSTRFPARYGCLSLIQPLAVHPRQPNALICADLRHDPASWLAASSEEIQERLYVSSTDLPDDAPRVALKLIRCNRAPMLAPLSVLEGADLDRIALDLETCLANAAAIRAVADLPARVRAAFDEPERAPPEDVDVALYSGFSSSHARQEMQTLRRLPAAALASFEIRSDDRRLPELLWRFRARNYPATLTPPEQARWDRERLQRLKHAKNSPAEFQAQIQRLRNELPVGSSAHTTLDQLQAWALEQHPALFAGEI